MQISTQTVVPLKAREGVYMTDRRTPRDPATRRMLLYGFIAHAHTAERVTELFGYNTQADMLAELREFVLERKMEVEPTVEAIQRTNNPLASFSAQEILHLWRELATSWVRGTRVNHLSANRSQKNGQ